MHKERSSEIIEQESPGMGNVIPKEDAYNIYGGDSAEVEIEALRDRDTFIRVPQWGVAKEEVCIIGRFVYTMRRKPLKAGRANTEAYIDNERSLDARFCAKVPQEEAVPNSPPHAAKLKSLSVLLPITPYIKWVAESRMSLGKF